jgi:hypothetical protein
MSDLTGPNQAQAMLRRVSPEGRARALREQKRRQRRAWRLIGRVLLAVLLAAAAVLAIDFFLVGAFIGLIVAIGAVIVLGAIFGVGLLRKKAAPILHPGSASIAALPQATAEWLETQALALPAPAANLADTIAGELGAMGPQIARLSPNEPAAQAVKRLLAVELPGLIERHQSVPPSLRGRVRQAGQSADDHLVNGLAIIRQEVSRMSEQLARGDVDALATQDRFLELKYQGEAMLGAEGA